MLHKYSKYSANVWFKELIKTWNELLKLNKVLCFVLSLYPEKDNVKIVIFVDDTVLLTV